LKRKLYLVGLVALVLVVLVSLVFSGCFNTKKDSDAEKPTLEGVAADVAALKSASSNYATQSQLNAYASQADLDAKIAEFDGMLDEMLSGISTPDLSGYVTKSQYDALLARVEALEADGGGGGDGGNTSGTVTVALDTSNTTFVTSSTVSSQLLPIKISNGTDDYQQVKFGLIMQCVTTSPNNTAEGFAYSTVAVNASTSTFAVTGVPGDKTSSCSCSEGTCIGDCQLIYFTWTGTETVLVSPNTNYTLYVHLNELCTTSAEVWQISVTSIIITEL
jgi:predicted small secreted protein